LDHELITSKLQAALGAVGETARTDEFQFALILHEHERAHPSVGQLLEALRAQPSLAIFDGMTQIVANHAARMEISNLARWLIRRGRDVGSVRAVADLQRYLDVRGFVLNTLPQMTDSEQACILRDVAGGAAEAC
jgi:hypothetical protein